jgi:hypothetical protein
MKFTTPIIWTGETKNIKIEVNAAFDSGNNQKLGFSIFKNGNIITYSKVLSTTNSSGGVNISNSIIVELNTNDQIDFRVKNVNNTDNISLVSISVILTEL